VEIVLRPAWSAALPQALGVLVLVVCLPLALVSLTVNTLLYDARFYEEGQQRFALGRTTALTLPELRAINAGIIRYFQTPTESLPQALAASGAPSDTFNQRELLHMEDVRHLVWWVGRVQWATLGAAALVTVGLLLWRGAAAIPLLGTAALLGGGLTLLLIGALGAAAVLDFHRFFVRFHLLSFANDYWILDPRTDRLIQMFPWQFWFMASLTIAWRTALLAVGLIVIGTLALVLSARRG